VRFTATWDGEYYVVYVLKNVFLALQIHAREMYANVKSYYAREMYANVKSYYAVHKEEPGRNRNVAGDQHRNYKKWPRLRWRSDQKMLRRQ